MCDVVCNRYNNNNCTNYTTDYITDSVYVTYPAKFQNTRIIAIKFLLISIKTYKFVPLAIDEIRK